MDAPVLALRNLEMRFVQSVDLAGRIANLFGAGLRTQVVHAVADVDLDVAPARSWALSASPAAENPRWAA